VLVLGYLGYETISKAPTQKASAAPFLSITSPKPNEQIVGTNFTIAGHAAPNTTITISNGNLTIAQTKSDNTGKWSVTSSLPAGNVSLTAKAIENPEFGYFTTFTDIVNHNFNRLRLSDNAINPNGGGWPISNNAPRPYTLTPSPTQNIFYGGSIFFLPTKPSKFDADNPTVPVQVTGAYPDDPLAGKGDFSPDGNLYFAPNDLLSSVSVINTTTNTWVKDIALDDETNPVRAIRSPLGNIHVFTRQTDNNHYVLNSETGDIIKKVPSTCTSQENNSRSAIFSRDAGYPYYFIPCTYEGKVIKMNIEDDTVEEELEIPNAYLGVLSLDNKKLYITSWIGLPNDDKLFVYDTVTGTLLDTINLTDRAFFMTATPDFQKIYVSSFNDPLVQTLDIIDTSNNSLSQLTTPGAVTELGINSSSNENVSVEQIGFVLGATAPTSETNPATGLTGLLADTGIARFSTTILLGIIIASTLYVYYDYRRHKKPLQEVNPKVNYTFLHHVKVVSIPVVRYRLSVTIYKDSSDHTYIGK
jgi:hypothetical protein